MKENSAIEELKAKLKSKLVTKNEISEVINSPDATNTTMPSEQKQPETTEAPALNNDTKSQKAQVQSKANEQ